MPVRISINCDMGESFGTYTKGSDAEVCPYITAANIAAGFHAGDPHVMHETVATAAAEGVDIGVHPGLPDKLGFGRREIDITPTEAREYVVYQIGALRAVAATQGLALTHVKPHGALYAILSDSEQHARAVLEGIVEVDPTLTYLATDIQLYDLATESPLDAVFEGYVDLDYRDDRSVIIPKRKEARDPTVVADRFVEIATEGTVESVSGTTLDIPADSICIHGDTPNVVEILDAIHRRLDGTDIELVSLTTQT
ncbi:5-oxoprolinase subunit PxpA [Haloarcula sp. S1CR25-12]|uniref:5-oxoprolinase subunit PxpA n=1 Tax=Haloarcula saliterrae TaxID=2950534 RepID=A0ABU2FE97_9EURY|nr:5-oxoprolinase subunit PxpA [Haloarcula sp. S1CR25-12]MDS0260564.1 5-oxoprolinase subunit PxpA [Haloarcula sp. S1CR25-12]